MCSSAGGVALVSRRSDTASRSQPEEIWGRRETSDTALSQEARRGACVTTPRGIIGPAALHCRGNNSNLSS